MANEDWGLYMFLDLRDNSNDFRVVDRLSIVHFWHSQKFRTTSGVT